MNFTLDDCKNFRQKIKLQFYNFLCEPAHELVVFLNQNINGFPSEMFENFNPVVNHNNSFFKNWKQIYIKIDILIIMVCFQHSYIVRNGNMTKSCLKKNKNE